MSQEVSDLLTGRLRFDSPQTAFCTHYSWFGVVKRDRLGIEELDLFYNRAAAALSPNLLTFRVELPDGGSERQKSSLTHPLFVEERDDHGFAGRMAFLDTDILCYSASLGPTSMASAVRATFLLPASEPRIRRSARFDKSGLRLTVHARAPRTDARDPDRDHPLTLCLIIPEGFRAVGVVADGAAVSRRRSEITTDGALVFGFAAAADELRKSEQTFVVAIGEGPSSDRIEERAAGVRLPSFDQALAASERWLDEALDVFGLEDVPKRLRKHCAQAAYQMICNSKAPRGQIGRFALFPSRGTYCCHYLWDSCFSSIGAAQFNERLAEDWLVALCENQEVDGKIPHFVCATWNRPGESQPPLIAWAAWRLYERFGNKELIRGVFEPVCRFVDWWFAHRDSDGDGVIEYEHALESGWDDSPRFDKGRIAAVDLNAFVNREMRLLAQMAPVIGREAEALFWNQRAKDHERKCLARLYDHEDGLFYDRLVEQDRFHKVLTPACFMPLWTGMQVHPEAAHRMIARYLISPRHFFGSRPFPSVAYSDARYEPDRWWRGPIWPNIAWVMTEILRAYGLEKEHKTAVRRLVEMITHSEEPNELYDSSTGEPLGARGLGWSCAVLMDLARQL